jgi:Tfp pilus assembly protein PilN
MRAVNLLPREDPRHPRKRLTAAVQLAIVSPFLVLSLLAAGYLMASSKVKNERSTLQALKQELAALPRPAPVVQTNAVLALEKSQRIAALASALQSRVAWDRILREISSVLPADVWLTSLSAQSPQTAVANATPPPPVAPSTTTTETTTETTSTTPAAPAPPAPAPPTTAPLNLNGYTYSQEGVARFLSRLAVIPEFQDVALLQSTETVVSGRTVVSFQIRADVLKQAPS